MPALKSKPAKPTSLEEADKTIRLLHETLATLTKRARQIEDIQSAGSHVRLLKKLRNKK